jgi:two-component system CheB/CheR fusion protein
MPVKTNGGFTTISLSVRLLPGSDGRQCMLLISFQDVVSTEAKPGRKKTAKPAERTRIEELEHDLAYLRESYQSSNEELLSTNEEMQATNEELQSTNEELETSREELQSINEELITVNSELQSKIEQLASMQNDMKNLLANINIGIIFLDRHLKIRSFTHDAIRLYRLIASDVGRPLTDIKSVLDNDDLTAATQAVLETLIPYERELQINGDTWILARIQPYRTLDNMIDGVVLRFTDITSRIKAIAAQQALILTEGIVNTVLEPVIVLDDTLKVIMASQTFYQTFQVTPDETVGRRIDELGNRQWDIPALRDLLQSVLPAGQAFENYEVEQDFPHIGHRKMWLNARRIADKAGESQLILLAIKVTA